MSPTSSARAAVRFLVIALVALAAIALPARAGILFGRNWPHLANREQQQQQQQHQHHQAELMRQLHEREQILHNQHLAQHQQQQLEQQQQQLHQQGEAFAEPLALAADSLAPETPEMFGWRNQHDHQQQAQLAGAPEHLGVALYPLASPQVYPAEALAPQQLPLAAQVTRVQMPARAPIQPQQPVQHQQQQQLDESQEQHRHPAAASKQLHSSQSEVVDKIERHIEHQVSKALEEKPERRHEHYHQPEEHSDFGLEHSHEGEEMGEGGEEKKPIMHKEAESGEGEHKHHEQKHHEHEHHQHHEHSDEHLPEAFEVHHTKGGKSFQYFHQGHSHKR